MNSGDEKSGVVGETAKAIAELAKSVPIYQDAIQPAAKEAGKSLQLVARAVNAALAPVEGLVWGVEKIKDFVRDRVASKLNNVPPEDVVQPKPHVAVPAIEALRYTGQESELAELYANLLATSIDKATAYRAHPGFVDMIKNMSPDEAKIMKVLATTGSLALINIRAIQKDTRAFRVTHRHLSLVGLKACCDHPPLTATYLDNLIRLGLVEIPPMRRLKSEEAYKEIEDYPEIKEIIDDLRKDESHMVEIERIKLEITDLGWQFVRSCVVDKAAQERD
jgi:hypothetical protein